MVQAKITTEDRTALQVYCKVQAAELRQEAKRHHDLAEHWRRARKLTASDGEKDKAKSAEQSAARWGWLAELVEAANVAASSPHTASVVGFMRESAESDREPEKDESAEDRTRWEASAKGADAVRALLEVAIGEQRCPTCAGTGATWPGCEACNHTGRADGVRHG